MISVNIESLQFASGETIELPPNGVTVIVGPNSAGKTRLLSEIVNAVANYPQAVFNGAWLQGISLKIDGSDAEFKQWFDERARVFRHHNGMTQTGIFTGSNADNLIEFDLALNSWKRSFSRISGHFYNYLGASDRAQHPISAPPRDPAESPAHPLHNMWDDRDEELRFSRLVERAFGFGVCLNRHSIRELYLYRGKPVEGDETIPPTQETLAHYARLPKVQEEGDGVRSFVRVLMETIISRKSIFVIDEPEAFLHPPQARLLGRLLVDETPQQSQVIIATHSADVLQGIIDGRRDRGLNIIRLSLDGDGVRYPKSLAPEKVEQLWSDPLMRYSRMLDGLFHRGIVICEADTDCRFYSAVVDAYPRKRSELDLIFTHVGGKARLARALKDMNGFGVRSVVIGDIDVLNNATAVKDIVQAAEGDYAQIKEDLTILIEYAKKLGAGPIVKNLKDVTRPILARSDSSPVVDSEKAAIREVIKIRSGWDEIKRGGTHALVGAAVPAVERILDYLKSIGIFVVPVGEVERWFPLDVRKGPAYVTEVLERGLHENPSPDLERFTESLIEYFE
ncbi:ATP-dependent nuclease [Actinomadura kijaniata]|uniref:ATP-dependent nuclease n=1 Tax=Actinomadura kijaniata TaxID=46161 RepID=UPI000A063F3D|nr:AAA family ATPase [Actinomadura kijaniata]